MPPLVIIMGLIFFGEVPAPLAIVGGVICLAGVALLSAERASLRKICQDDVGTPCTDPSGTCDPP